jgi:hypothetical protein
MPIAINDNGTWRYPKALGVNDNTTWRVIKRLAVNDGGVWRVPFFYIGTLGVGNSGSNYGYSLGGFGTLSPTTDVNGITIAAMLGSSSQQYIQLNGSTAGITQTSYLKLITVNGVTINTSTASSFINNGSEAVWIWGSDLLGIQALNGSNVSFQLTPA